jgi:hypothetical protein
MPGSTEVILEGQAVHSPVPVLAFTCPAEHAVHTTPSPAAAYPALQVQFVSASLPVAELVPVGHVWHIDAPVSVLYVPASHAVQATPSDAAVYPTSQVQ